MFWIICKCIKYKHLRNYMYLSLYNVSPILSWCTFGSNNNVKVFLKAMPQAWHTIASQSSSGWMGSVGAWPFSDLYGIKSGIWLGHSRTVTELFWSHSSFNILLSCPAERWTVGPSLRSRVLWGRFSSGMSLYIVAVIFPAILTSLPGVLPPPWWYWFPQNMMPGTYQRVQVFSLQNREFRFSRSDSFSAAFKNSGRDVMCLLRRSSFHQATLLTRLLLWKVLLYLAEWPSSSWSPPQNKALLSRLFNSDGWLALRKAGGTEFSKSFGS